MKSQVVVSKVTKEIICTDFCPGSCHDFRLFKESKLPIHPDNNVAVDSGYQGIQKQHKNSQLPKKKSKKSPLAKQDKRCNRELASTRVTNEHVIGRIKRFKIIANRYRNRRKRFSLRFNLIAGFYNYELS